MTTALAYDTNTKITATPLTFWCNLRL